MMQDKLREAQDQITTACIEKEQLYTLLNLLREMGEDERITTGETIMNVADVMMLLVEMMTENLNGAMEQINMACLEMKVIA